jgi:hypothetical protein
VAEVDFKLKTSFYGWSQQVIILQEGSLFAVAVCCIFPLNLFYNNSRSKHAKIKIKKRQLPNRIALYREVALCNRVGTAIAAEQKGQRHLFSVCWYRP